MKKVSIFLALMLACFFTASALTPEEIIGKWESKPINAPTGDKSVKMQAFITVDFAEDNTCTDISETKMHIADGSIFVDLFITVKTKGSYVVEGDSITITDDFNTIETDYDVNVRGTDDDQLLTTINSQMEQVAQQIITGVKAEMQNDPVSVLNGVMVMGKKMMCTVHGEAVTFNRKKK